MLRSAPTTVAPAACNRRSMFLPFEPTQESRAGLYLGFDLPLPYGLGLTVAGIVLLILSYFGSTLVLEMILGTSWQS